MKQRVVEGLASLARDVGRPGGVAQHRPMPPNRCAFIVRLRSDTARTVYSQSADRRSTGTNPPTAPTAPTAPTDHTAAPDQAHASAKTHGQHRPPNHSRRVHDARSAGWSVDADASIKQSPTWTQRSFWLMEQSFWLMKQSFWLMKQSFWLMQRSFWLMERSFWLMKQSFWLMERSFWLMKILQKSRSRRPARHSPSLPPRPRRFSWTRQHPPARGVWG